MHGDVRESHVVIQHSSTTRDAEGRATRAYLLQFDWALEEARARYPAQSQMDGDVEWVAPVKRPCRAPIRKADDEYMLARLRDSFNAKVCSVLQNSLHTRTPI